MRSTCAIYSPQNHLALSAESQDKICQVLPVRAGEKA